MSTGKIKWFDNTKGWGFIRPDDSVDKDVFVHFSSIRARGYKKLKAGQMVTYSAELKGERLFAYEVMPLPLLPNSNETDDTH
jgi:cold shock protein